MLRRIPFSTAVVAFGFGIIGVSIVATAQRIANVHRSVIIQAAQAARAERERLVARRVAIAVAAAQARQQARLRAEARRTAWERGLAPLPSRGLYRRRFQVKATAYIPANQGIEGGRYTKTERDGRSSHGVAVDPHLIPLGTRLWIPGYGHAIADDVGSAIRGHHVDIRVQSREQMRRWGTRQIPVYVLADVR